MKTPALPVPQRLSLVTQTVQCLRRGIRAGQWREHLPAERELAAQLQIGRKTLRAALGELERDGWLEVSSRKRRRIRIPTGKRRAVAQKRKVAILMPSALETVHSRRMYVMNAVRAHLADAGFAIEMHVNPGCFSAHPVRALEKLERDHPGVVWVVFGSKEPMLRWFTREQLPCLIIGSCAPEFGLPSIDVDHRGACRHAGRTLWRKGHRRFALVLPRDAFDGDVHSEEGLREGLNVHPDAQIQALRHDGTKAHLCALIDRVMRTEHPPTAYIVARAIHALTVTMHLMRRGMNFPKDVAVISRDEEPFIQATAPAIAHYAVSLPLYARRISMAARQLAEDGGLPARAIRLIPEFFAGETM